MHATISIASTALHGLGEPIPGLAAQAPAVPRPRDRPTCALGASIAAIRNRNPTPQSGFRISLLPYRRHFQFYSESLLELFRIGE
jgi:hypothetical protein